MGQALSPPELENFSSLEWTEVSPRVTPAVRAALEKVLADLNGSSLTREECSRLANCDGEDLLGLLIAANEIRADG